MSDAPDAAAIVEAAADAVRQLENLNIQRKSKRGSEWEIQQVLCFMHLQSLLDYILSG